MTGLDMHDAARNPHACVLHISPSRAYEVIVSVKFAHLMRFASYKDGGLSQLALSHPLILPYSRKLPQRLKASNITEFYQTS